MVYAVHNSQQKQFLECALYVVATPIGNLRDITLRALDILGGVDVIAAEDTRNTSNLLKHYNLSVDKFLILHKHNERKALSKIVDLLSQNKSVALVTDAGTPAISDPGALLVQAVRDAGLRVIPIPGANAAIAALSASGLIDSHFLFYGFLPNKSSGRRSELHKLVTHPYTLIFYEAPHRIIECVSDLLDIFGGERIVVIAREITKLFENIHSCRLNEAVEWLESNPNNQKGEFVILLPGQETDQQDLDSEAVRVLTLLLKDLPLKSAVQLTTKITGAGRNKIYQQALKLTQKDVD